jgi:hypothetical protein
VATAEANDVDVEHDEQPNIRPVRLDLIRLDGGTQFRVSLKEGTVDDYAEAFKAGKALPPPDVYSDGTYFWPADGHQRIAAARKAGLEVIPCNIHPGGRRDAILHAVGSNASHGDRRTRADARNAVGAMLRDVEWGQWSNAEIGRRCRVDEKTVAKVRRELTPEFPESSLRKGADGRTIDTSRIGSRPLANGDDPPDVAEGRRTGTIPEGVEVEVTEVGGEPEPEGEVQSPPSPDEPTDAEYLGSLPARPQLSDACRKRFDREALFFRELTPLRLKFERASKPLCNDLKKAGSGHIGPFLSRLYR